MIEYFIGLLGQVIPMLQYNNEREKEKSLAISALKEAVRATKSHINNHRIEDVDIESTELKEKWSLVAEKIRPFNENTARIFEMKADYWQDPYGFHLDIEKGRRRFEYRFMLIEVERMIEKQNY